MAALLTSPPIRTTAAAFVAGREAGLSIKPLLARSRQRYGTNGDRDRQVFDERRRAFTLSLIFFVFLAGFRPISYRLLVEHLTVAVAVGAVALPVAGDQRLY